MSFIKELTGQTEKQLLHDSLSEGTKRYGGEFSQVEIGEMKKEVVPSRNPCLIEIRQRSPNGDQRPFDTSVLQAKLKSEDVAFQLASTFSCLEYVGRDLYDGDYFETMLRLRSQAINASIGTLVGTIIRWEENKKRPINLLEKCQCHVNQGKVVEISGKINVDDVQIGIQKNVYPTHVIENGLVKREGCGRSINQIFVSTVQNPKDGVINRHTVEFLEAAYVGTYLAADIIGAKTLVLTLVGGGSYNNPDELIAEALAEAHLKWSGNLDKVILPIWNPDLDINIFLSALKRVGVPENLIKYSNRGDDLI